jgi:hypothetical protein
MFPIPSLKNWGGLFMGKNHGNYSNGGSKDHYHGRERKKPQGSYRPTPGEVRTMKEKRVKGKGTGSIREMIEEIKKEPWDSRVFFKNTGTVFER